MSRRWLAAGGIVVGVVVALVLRVATSRSPAPTLAGTPAGPGEGPQTSPRAQRVEPTTRPPEAVTAAPATARGNDPGARPPQYQERAPGEWQGMLIDRSIRPPCDDSAHCGLGRACVDGACVGCTSDGTCARGETCVLDHCVEGTRVACRRRADCPARSQCVLSGYTATPRGTDGMRAYCVSDEGEGQRPEAPAVEAAQPSRVDVYTDLEARARAANSVR